MPVRNLSTPTVLRKIYFVGAAFLILAGSVGCQKAPQQTKPTARPPKTRAVDPLVQQQQYYDRGVQEYSREKYQEAQTLFQRVVDLNPDTELGLKARENLKKTQQILKTLDKIKSK